MRVPKLRAALLALLVLPALASSPALASADPSSDRAATATATGEWQDGKHDEDQTIDFVTNQPATGVSANVGWRGSGDRVPKVGEIFYIRGYAGLVALPYSGKVAVVPEFLVPNGVEYADEDAPVYWALTKSGQQQQLRTGGLEYFRGANGGVTVEPGGGQPWVLRQGDVLEVQIPVRATRTLKGPATQQPECQDRRDGRAPCPVAQAGDHLQVAFTVGGHGGNKSYVTPYVGLFASAAGSPGNPSNPGNPGTPAPSVRAGSTTSASFTVSRRAKGRAVVTVRSAKAPTGRVVVTDRGRAIGTATLRGGRATVALPKLRKGRHVLVARYAGSATVKPSASKARTVRLR